MTYKVKNWERFQHYSKRNPPWIKFHKSLLDDPEWFELSDAASRMLANCWLLASEGNGILPSLKKVAFRLRMTEERAAELISQLNHWLEDDASTMLAKRKHVAPKSLSETETETETDDDGGVARAREPLVSKEACELADEVAVVVGHDPKHPPPAWCGAAMTVSKWLREGWGRDVILVGVRGAMANKRDGPPVSIRYFERAIATEVARQKTPLPVVEIQSGKPNGKRTVHQAADDALARIRALNVDAPGIRDPTSESTVRLLPAGRRE
jgi:hypothetical protein